MKTSVIEVHDMLSILTVDEVERRIGGVPGVESATVNYAAGNATVRYDETRLEVADIKVIVHQRGNQSAGESPPIHVSERESAPKPAAVPTPKVASASASTSEAAPPSASLAASPKPSPVAPAAKPLTSVAAAPKIGPDAKPSTPAAAEARPDSWKVHALSLAVTLCVAYAISAIFDALFAPFGLLAALAPASPLPIAGSPLAYLTGFALFTVAGFVFGALHGIAWEFWSKRLR